MNDAAKKAAAVDALREQLGAPKRKRPAPKSPLHSGSTATKDLDRTTPKQRAAEALRNSHRNDPPESVDGSPTAPDNPL